MDNDFSILVFSNISAQPITKCVTHCNYIHALLSCVYVLKIREEMGIAGGLTVR